MRKSHCFDVYTPVAMQISSFGVVARQPNQLTGILKSPYESLDPAKMFFFSADNYIGLCYFPSVP